MRRLGISGGLAILIAAFVAAPSPAATLELVGTYEKAIFVASDPVDPERLLVADRGGQVLEERPGTPTSVYADLTALVACCEKERGLLSIAPAPDFGTTGRVYAAYTGLAAAGGDEGDIHVDSIVPTEEEEGAFEREPILTVAHSDTGSHNGGQLQFGPDGYLYLSTGDGGGTGDPFETAQDEASLLGKILRIDPRPGSEPPYAIPPGNPFAAGPGAPEVWAYGLRNPWRFSFDRLSGDTLIADVGQGEREEVDLARAPGPGLVGGGGANYGWSCREGTLAYSEPAANCAGASGFVEPIFDYPHHDPGDEGAYGCAITGGYVARDPGLGDLYGRYLYADFCTGEIRSLAPPTATTPAVDRSEGISVPFPVSFGEDSCGRLYVVQAIAVYRFVGPGGPGCHELPGPEHPGSSPIPEAGEIEPPARLAIHARRRGSRPAVIVRARPCAALRGRRVLLRRGGRPYRAKRLDRSCRAVFVLRLVTRASFRALLRVGPGARTVRSRRLAYRPRRLRHRSVSHRRRGAAQRSQVRTIALAKPIP